MVKPYDRPKGPTAKKLKSSKLWENYYFEEELSKIPYETKSEEEVRFYGWRWMVYASTMNMRKIGRASCRERVLYTV